MNILPKKKWHVRTKENIARVRRDEAKAAEEERQRLDRAITAENERRLDALRNHAAKKAANLEPFTLRATAEASISTTTGHVNLFQDLEAAERNNFGQGNKEYEEEKRKEQAEFDSKLGIQKCFAEGTNELNKQHEWYEKVSRPWVKDEPKVKPSTPVTSSRAPDVKRNEDTVKEKRHHKRRQSKSSTSEESSDSDDRKGKKKKKKEKKNKKKKHKHHHSSDDEVEVDNCEAEIEKRNKLAALREERIRRERAERQRAQQLLDPKKATAPPKQKYNSMFNPDLCRK
uniref:Cir_N domain-containing protein n=1 Tax=Haemonchus contortus TaxID=6289 RepID=A0A7I4XY06_HAECO